MHAATCVFRTSLLTFSKCAALGVALLLADPALFAGTVVPTSIGGGAWYSGVAPNETPTDAFWDNQSKDGSQCNVGYWLGGADTWGSLLNRCSNDGNMSSEPSDFKGPGNLAFYGSGSSAASPVGWEFAVSGAETHSLEMMVEVAGWNSTNVLGYYTTGANGLQSGVIFNGSATPGATQVIALGGDVTRFGFYLCPNGNCTASSILYSGMPWGPTAGKFALFSEIPQTPGPGVEIEKYWVGVEDVAGYDAVEQKGDFNDIIFSATVRPVHVPEGNVQGQFAFQLIVAGALCFYAAKRKYAR